MRQYDPALVLRVNEVFHDLGEQEYDEQHPEILKAETQRWQRTGERFVATLPHPLTLLDVGTGTGFVPRSIASALRPGDRLICADLSARMLEVCRQNLEPAHLPCSIEYLKLSGQDIALPSGSCHVITMNSVLHHIPDFAPFLADLDRLLAPGGRLIIGHEPSRSFYASRSRRLRSWLAGLAFMPRRSVVAVLRKLRLVDLAKTVLRRRSGNLAAQAATLQSINDRLLKEGTISTPLTNDELTAIVDIQSPTAGGYHPERGIDLRLVQGQYLPAMQIEHLETYNHLGDGIATAGRLARSFDQWLARRSPEAGATFHAVLRKPL